MAYDVFQYETLDETPVVLVDFLMDLDAAGYVALTGVHFELIGSSTDRDRMEANASWPTFTYYKRLLVLTEYDILAQSSDDFESFWITTLNAMLVAPDILQTERAQGRLRIKPSGYTEELLLPCIIQDPPIMPRKGLSPSAGQVTTTFKAFRPYWVGATSNDNIWYV